MEDNDIYGSIWSKTTAYYYSAQTLLQISYPLNTPDPVVCAVGSLNTEAMAQYVWS